MLPSLLFFFVSFAPGLIILEIGKILFPPLVQLIIAIILGAILNVLIIFGSSFFFGLTLANILAIIFLTFSPSLIYLRKRLGSINLIGKFEIKNNLFVLIILVILSIFIILLFTKSIYVNEAGVIAGNRLVWTDWPVHLAIIASFVHGDNFPPQNPLYTGQLISYPFFSDFLSSVLQLLGADLKTSVVLPGIIFGLSIIFLLYYLGLSITREKNIAAIGIFIGIFWGGLGFLYFIFDLLFSANFWQTLIYPPYEYTFFQGKNLWFFSFLYSELLPQRSFLFGAPMFLIALIFLIKGISTNKKSCLLTSGSIVGLMPFFHMHSFISLLLLVCTFVPLTVIDTFYKDGINKAKEQSDSIFKYFILPIIGLGLIQTPIFLNLDTNQVFGFNLGWMKGQEPFFLFWFKNTGFFIPLLIFAFFKTKLSSLEKNLMLASSILFILPNIFRFAPWPYDNLKIMTYWYFISSFFAAKSLYYFYQKKIFWKTLTIILFLTLILSGMIEVARVFNTDKTNINLWSKEDVELARIINEKTPAKSTLLTAAIHDHPATALAGRKIIIGYPGNAWSWGHADWAQRESDVRDIFKANLVDPSFLLTKYGVDYILISPREKNFEPALNEDYFASKYELTTAGQNFKLYKVR